MKNNRVGKYVAFAVFGFVMLVAGLVVAILLPDAHGIMLTLPYIVLGVGSGIFGGSLSAVLKNRIFLKNPQLAKQAQIDAKDERNLTIAYKAKSKAYDLTLIVFSALILFLALVQVQVHIILVVVAAYLVVIFGMIYYLVKYQKEM